jgi:hypothetical protein
MTPGSALGVWGLPPDAPAMAALAAALIALVLAVTACGRAARVVGRVPPAFVVATLALAAALLSWGYLLHYLRGGPRIIDATSYWLEARALASGQLGFDVPWPSASFRGRFLLASADGQRLAVIFPPGWPALLALGFVAGVPRLIGPLIAAGLVAATWALGLRASGRRDVALVAATLSMLSAALRYHTADSMSHGWAALLFAGALVVAGRGVGRALVAGGAVGWLVATRPLTGVVAAALVALALSGRRERLAALLGLTPGLLLLGAHQALATGSIFGSTQLAYYAVADGPPGCFRWGFGPGIGCLHEHGDFVRARLPDGFGLVEALGTTARRLVLHLRDLANAEPLALLVPLGAALGWRRIALRRLALGGAAIVCVYAPFYFDASYPGGGARLLADALPLEHVLCAVAAVELAMTRFVWPVSLAGFALHTSFDHRALAEREGGRPMFEPARLEQAGVTHGLVLAETDHAFSLGHDPAARDATRAIVVARRRGDDHDVILWDRLGRPPVWRYAGPIDTNAHLEPMRLTAPGRELWFEAEAEWPPLEVSGGWAHPAFPGGCASAGRALALRAAPRAAAPAVVVELAVPSAGRWRVEPRWIATREVAAAVAAELGATRWRADVRLPAGQCWSGPSQELDLSAGPQPLRLVGAEGLWLDGTRLYALDGGSEKR